MRHPIGGPARAVWVLLSAVGCAQEHGPRERSDAAVEAADGRAAMPPGEAEPGAEPLDAGVYEQDAEAPSQPDAEPPSQANATPDMDAADAASDAEAAPDAEADAGDTGPSPDAQCGPRVPEVMIVLDRSQSMAPAVPAGVSCANVDAINACLLSQTDCACVGIDCNTPPYQGTVVCGGANPSPAVDRWQPAVQGLETVTQQFQDDLSFGLTLFPGEAASMGSNGDLCAPGTVRVPMAANTAAQIAQVLNATQPAGATPLSATLTAVLEHLQTRPGPSGPRYVVLLTDGQPTCPNARGASVNLEALAQDHALALQALDALRRADVKTFVFGIVTPGETALAAALGELATYGGTDHFYPVQETRSIVDQFAQVASSITGCEPLAH